MTEQEAKEYVKLYNAATGQNYSISDNSGFDELVNDSETTEITKAEFNQLSAKDQRDYLKENPVSVSPAKQNLTPDERRAEKLEAYNAKEQKRQEIVNQKIEAQKQANIQRQEAQNRRQNPETMQFAQSGNTQNSGIDGRQIQTIITLLEKIAQNTSMGLS